ncbi:MAG: hypothetical protein ACRCU2_02000, partial [Planktothrix sp.]
EIAKIKGGKRVPKGYQFETIPTSHPYITVADFTENGTVSTKKLKYVGFAEKVIKSRGGKRTRGPSDCTNKHGFTSILQFIAKINASA